MVVDERTWLIYKHQNKNNNKVYIGQTINSIQRRSGGGSGYTRCKRFYSAIQCYGYDNFTHEILVDNIKTQEEADESEKYYISLYKSKDPQYGYNIRDGGQGENSFLEQPVYQYTLSGEYVQSFPSSVIASIETGIHSSSIGATCLGNRMSAGGYLWTREYKDKLEPYSFNTRTNKIYQYDLYGNYLTEYIDAFDAGQQFGDYASHRIIECCDNKRSYAFDSQWRYYKTLNIGSVSENGGECKIAYQYNLDGTFVKKYPKATEAAKSLNVTAKAIQFACRNHGRKSCGYYWSYKYVDNYFDLKD